jgi:tripartite ATP-independent transporter DctP family solute receptor
MQHHLRGRMRPTPVGDSKRHKQLSFCWLRSHQLLPRKGRSPMNGLHVPRLSRRQLLGGAGVAGLSLAMGGCAVSKSGARASDAEFVITSGHPSPTGHFQITTYEYLKKAIEEKSSGRIAMRVYSDGIFGDDREIIESVQLGNLQIGCSTSSPFGAFVPEMNIWDMPFLFEDRNHAYRVLDSDFGRGLLGRLDNFNLLGRGYWDNGFRHLTTHRNPVADVADVKGLSIRTLENPLHIKAWQSVGANPTPMAYGEVYVGLQQGTIDAQENSFVNIAAMRFFEVQQYLVETKHIYSPMVLYVNRDFYMGLPSELQDVVDEATHESVEFTRSIVEETERKSIEKIQAGGTEITSLDGTVRDQLREQMQGGVRDLMEKIVGKDQVETVLQTAEELK